MKTVLSFQKIMGMLLCFIGMLIVIRFIYSGKYAYVFLVWNLFLAWIPFALSGLFKKSLQYQRWQQLLLFFGWLLFFPNALYIVTDLIHLNMASAVPKWYDAVLLFAAATAGLLMAFVSLLKAEYFLACNFRDKMVQAIVVLVLFLGSFGVYLGRFLRWNSWDIINNPLILLSTVFHRIAFPFLHVQTWTVTIILTILFYLVYQAIKKLPGYLNQAMQ